MDLETANVFRFGGAAGSLAAGTDWAASPLGPVELWPQELRQAFKLCLELPTLTALYWGPRFYLLYGDAYAPVLADRHPSAFARPAAEVWPELWDKLGAQLQSVMQTGQVLSSLNERLEVLEHGTINERYYNFTFSPIRSDQGDVCGVLNTAHETTTEVRAEMVRSQARAALDQQTLVSNQTRELLQALTDGTPDVIYVKDTLGRMVHVNHTVCHMFGRSRAGVIGMTDAQWLPPGQAAKIMQNDQMVMASRQTHTFEEELLIVGDSNESGLTDAGIPGETGAVPLEPMKPLEPLEPLTPQQLEVASSTVHKWMVTRLYLATKSPWLAPDKTLLGMFCVARDITERKAQENLLRQLNTRLHEKVAMRTLERDRIWRVSRDIFVVAGTNGRFISVNPAFERVLGWTLEEALDLPALALVHPDDVPGTTEQFRKLLAGDSSAGFQCRLRRLDGSYRWLNWTAVPEGELVYAVARDVTGEKAQAETLERAEEQLRQAQKMEAVGLLTGGIAHDFNNLLATILSSLELLQRRADSGQFEDLQRYVSAARSSAQRAASLTQRLLAFSRRQALDPQPLDVNTLVTGMLELMQRSLGEGIVIRTDLDPALPQAFTDANQLESALLNLAINARDAMPQGGALGISTAPVRLDDQHSGPPEELPPGDYVTVSLSDTGTGMTADVIAKAFDPFFTTKPIGQGTGLGLSMVYGYVKQSGGHVAIESAVGEGTLVRLYLPQLQLARAGGQADAVSQKAIESGAETGPSATAPGAGESILVVEDEGGVRMVLLEVLRELGYVTHEAVDSKSAMRLVDSGVRIDLLVSDVGLPGTNGRQLADMIRARRPGLKVLFVTGYIGHAEIRAEFLGAGMDMLSKPFAIDELAQKIQSMLGKDAGSSPKPALPAAVTDRAAEP